MAGESGQGPVVVAGAGDVGGRLAACLARDGVEVLALRRRPPQGLADGVTGIQADLATGAGLSALPRQPSALVFCAAPDQRDETAYRALYVDGLSRLLAACDAPRVVFVSSTAVYGEHRGEWVDESTPANPVAFNGRVLRQAERLLEGRRGATCLRLSGLYGPGRTSLLRRAFTGEPGSRRWGNRIHVQDAATALAHLLALPAPAPLYLGSDNLPALDTEVLAWLREQAGQLPVAAPSQGPVQGRRVRNEALRATGWTPAFPDYRAGYGPLIGPGV
ncbi:NAD-dependent epimerase/dehydratase family protein [Arenimonas donghaensis]|uniref:NAD-dependent epimerase/dehydratase family protein n=1 Tax=Arenimonas donghaensis TaxID=375061 RepID=UPI000558D7FD|nr:NAD-dependent epimerase/dehydratase family protein [Arenimonas donghaensis]